VGEPGVSEAGVTTKVRRSPKLLLIAMLVLTALLLIYPVRNGITRPVVLLSFATDYVAALVLFWRRRYLRYGLIAPAVLVALMFAAPGRPFDSAALRAKYVMARSAGNFSSLDLSAIAQSSPLNIANRRICIFSAGR
jgi:hypothetical protein